MSLSTITARVDRDDKVAFDQFCSSVGLNSSSAINLYVKAVLREKRIPFDIYQSEDPFYGESHQAFLRESLAQARRGEVVVRDVV